MIHLSEITDLKPVYAFQTALPVPYFFPVDFSAWKRSFLQDTDGEGRTLFSALWGLAAWEDDTLLGFVQYGHTAFGFDGQGELSSRVSYPVIRSLYFAQGREDAGQLLLDQAMEDLGKAGQVYAFFHYFGMTCFARHGKLPQQLPHIRVLLTANGFQTEHENVYYSARLQETAASGVTLLPKEKTAGDHQALDFLLEGEPVGCCEVHFPVAEGIAYLRWIYIFDNAQNKGVGSRCMSALKSWLLTQGMAQLDTDTALDNLRAQHYYEKNGFARLAVTRSFYRLDK